jgi:hypothetical protein
MSRTRLSLYSALLLTLVPYLALALEKAPPNHQELLKPGRPLALIFLSTQCPCSQSHEPVLKSLKAQYPQVDFYGIHSNVDESEASAEAHFSASALGFSVLQDDRALLAEKLGALKTPHAFLYDGQGTLFYSGGIDNSNTASEATEPYLKNALSALLSGKKLSASEAKRRTLGCLIAR